MIFILGQPLTMAEVIYLADKNKLKFDEQVHQIPQTIIDTSLDSKR